MDRKRTENLYTLICELVDAGQEQFRPGDLCALLRARNQPMGAWKVWREFSTLEGEGLIVMDPASAVWRRTGKSMANAPSTTANADAA